MAERPLEDIIRDLAKSGRLNYLSLAFTSDGVWEASYRGVENKDHRHKAEKDVICALRGALTGRAGTPQPEPKGKAKTPRKAPERQRAAEPAQVDDDIFGDL